MNLLTLDGHRALFLPLTILLAFAFVICLAIRKRSGEVRNQWCRVVVVGTFLLLLGPLFPVHYDLLPSAQPLTLAQADLIALAQMGPLPEPAKPFPWMAVYWIGAGLVLSAVLLSFGRAHFLRKKATRMPGELDVRVSKQIRVPMAVGFFDASILVPQSATHDPQLGTVLLHEAAHVRRKDTLWLVPMSVLQVLFWYQPLVWLWALQLRATAEHAADDWVIRQGVAPAAYAEQLLDYAKTLSADPGLWAGSPFARSGRLAYRLRRILNPLTEKTMITRKHSLALLSGAVVLTASLCAISFAQDSTTHPKSKAKSKHAKKSTPIVNVQDGDRVIVLPGEPVYGVQSAPPARPARSGAQPVADAAAPAAAPAVEVSVGDAPAALALPPARRSDVPRDAAPAAPALAPAVDAAPPAAMAYAMPAPAMLPQIVASGARTVVVDGVVYDIKKDKHGKPYLVKSKNQRQASQRIYVTGGNNLRLSGATYTIATPRAVGADRLRAIQGLTIPSGDMIEVKKALEEANREIAIARREDAGGQRLEIKKAMELANREMVNARQEALGQKLTAEQKAEVGRAMDEAQKSLDMVVVQNGEAKIELERALKASQDTKRFMMDPKSKAEWEKATQRFKSMKMEQFSKMKLDSMTNLFDKKQKLWLASGGDNEKLRAELSALRAELAQMRKELAELKAKKSKPSKEEGSIDNAEANDGRIPILSDLPYIGRLFTKASGQ